jgi:hypothetical protein
MAARAAGGLRSGIAPEAALVVQALDTNVLARFYCDDPHDPEAKRQRPIARRVIVESSSLYVPLSVVLELEWVMRGFYEIDVDGVCSVIEPPARNAARDGRALGGRKGRRPAASSGAGLRGRASLGKQQGM